MKTLVITTLLVGAAFMQSCSSEVTVDETNLKDGEVENADSPEAEGAVKKGPGISCSELVSDFGELEATKVTISAISWGNSNTMSGEVQLSLGDEKLEGMKQAPVVVVISKDEAEAAGAIERDAAVTIRATVLEQAYGSVKLVNPVVL